MKKHICTVFAFAVFAASAMATQSTELEVKVPFAFTAGTSTLPAGTYRVTRINSGCILIQGEKGGVFLPSGDLPIDLGNSGKTSFKFDRAGDKYVLQSVHSGR
jgi:hypothetical protein